MFEGRKVILGISGGIAAYKSAFLLRLLIKQGADVKVVMTDNAQKFVTKLTFETLSKNQVYCDVFDEKNDFSTEHIALTDWADLCIIAPATANIIGKLANGIADDALSTTLLAIKKPVFIAPAMNWKMLDHFSVRNNIDFLKENGIHIIESASGELACGDKGQGRMAEPEVIICQITEFLKKKSFLKNKKILITAGPTYEAIDPVRFIGNHSSGKMGFALAEQASLLGADVTLISGPSSLELNKSIKRINVINAEEMYSACVKEFSKADITIMAAAVADYTPVNVSSSKIKKSAKGEMELKLKPTKDILFELGKKKAKSHVLVGFALETDHEVDHAIKKIHNKNLDFIVLNTLKEKGTGFGTETNKITIIDKSKKIFNFDLKLKKEVASDILNHLKKYL